MEIRKIGNQTWYKVSKVLYNKYLLENGGEILLNDVAETKGVLEENSGIKYSSDKVPLYTVLNQFKKAFIEVAKRSKSGHEKYKEFDKDWKNFKRIPNAKEEYSNALVRHLLREGEDTELEHLAACAWNSLALLEIYLDENQKL